MGAKKKSERVVSKSFKDLKKVMKHKRVRESAATPAKKDPASFGDEEMFFNAMKEVQEIREFRQIPLRINKRRKPALFSDTDALSSTKGSRRLERIVKGSERINLSNTQEYVEWTNPDYRDDVVDRLRDGCYSVQDSLDIHGLIVEEAEVEIERFIHESIKKGFNCIKVVTGRGRRSPKGPVLKNAVVHWLSRRFRKCVVAFVSARQCDGGLGALYVLLR